MKPASPESQLLSADTAEKIKQYLTHEYAESTAKAYRRDLRQYQEFCTGTELIPETETAVLCWITHLAERCKRATVERKLAALRKFFDQSDADNPARTKPVARLFRSIRRSKSAVQKQAKALSLIDLRKIEALDSTSDVGCRDRALFLLGFAGAFRVSELTAVRLKEVSFTARGATVYVPRSKTDQEGEGMYKAFVFGRTEAFCPICCLKAWIERCGERLGPEDFIFHAYDKNRKPLPASDGKLRKISRQAVHNKIKRLFGPDFSAHSLRAGFVTTAKEKGADDASVMNQTGHKTPRMIHRYSRHITVFDHNAVNLLGL